MSSKIKKPNGETATPFELEVAQVLLELQTSSDLQSVLRELYFVAAKEFDLGASKKALVVYVPVPQWDTYKKIATRLMRELEKKFPGHTAVLLSWRRILPKPSRKSRRNAKQKRPRSRTLTEVHQNMLNDLVYPAEIVGQRMRVCADGKRIQRIFLDKGVANQVEHKLEIFQQLYKKLTSKEVVFDFPAYQL